MFRRIQSNTTRRRNKAAGLTLIEVMVATALFTVGAIASLLTIFQAFKTMARARYMDRASNVLKIAADQFQNSKARNPGAVTWRNFYTATAAPTGEGMAWNKQLQTLTHEGTGDNLGADYIVGTVDGLMIPLNTVGASDTESPTATLTRDVKWISINTALSTSAETQVEPAATTGGQLVRAIFRIEYTFLGRTEQLQTVVLRNLNPTDK
ncbi:MAG: type II secretion system protein [Opitutaceae bacterium]|nr:type II secretion system protein [Opitutaceae bacterium]